MFRLGSVSMKISGTKVNLRQFTSSDFNQIVLWNKDELLSYFIGRRLPSTIDECQHRYFKKAFLLRKSLAIEDKGGNILGEIEIDHILWKRKQAELFMYIGHRDIWGKGYGTDALTTFIDYIFNEKRFKSIYLKVYQNNTRAIRCYEKCGFKKKGILKFSDHELHGDNVILMERIADGREG